MSRISLAFKSFFAILFGDGLPEAVARAYGFVKESELKPPPPPPKPEFTASDGALQILGILQRDARLVDIVMEDLSGADDEQIGAAFRRVHGELRDTLGRYLKLEPVIDGVERTTVTVPKRDPNAVKLLGNVDSKKNAGMLIHRGWRVTSVELPKIASGQDVKVLSPAEIEIE